MLPAATATGTADFRSPAWRVGDRRPGVLAGIRADVRGGQRWRVWPRLAQAKDAPRLGRAIGTPRLAWAVPAGVFSANRSTSGDLRQVVVGRDRQFLVPTHHQPSQPTASSPTPPVPTHRFRPQPTMTCPSPPLPARTHLPQPMTTCPSRPVPVPARAACRRGQVSSGPCGGSTSELVGRPPSWWADLRAAGPSPELLGRRPSGWADVRAGGLAPRNPVRQPTTRDVDPPNAPRR
jgi:hypothetical protein